MPKYPVTLIYAVARNGVIGLNGSMPWSLPSDLAQFKKRTFNRPMIMGRKTFQSLPGILPGRPHIVLSSQPALSDDTRVMYVSTLTDAIDHACEMIDQNNLDREIMVIGGATLFDLCEPLATSLHVSEINADPDGDRFWNYDSSLWQLAEQHKSKSDQRDSASYEIMVYTKKA